MYHCYILQSLTNGDYYIGCTDDCKARLKLHNVGGVKSTKYAMPWKIIYFESFTTLKEARKRELQIKKWKSRKAVERLIQKI